MPILQQKQKSPKPARTIVLSFLLVILAGTLLLTLPLSSKSGSFTNPLDAFFTATSATCVTGLIVYDTYTHWNIFGQLVILLMIQIGGLGLVTFTSFFNFLIGKKLGLRSMQVASESVSTQGFSDVKQLIKNVVKFSLAFEGAGALLLMIPFVSEQGAKGIYTAIFLSVSAFCNAGFDILGYNGQFSSLVTYAGNPLVILPISMLITAGGLGFVVWSDLLQYRKTKHLILQTKIVLIVSAALIALGTLAVLICEGGNPSTMAGMSFGQKLIRSFFQSVTFRTAGFNSISIADMSPLTKMFALLFMFVGAAPNSTGGGIKVTTLAVVLFTVVSVMKSEPDTIIMGRKVEKFTVYKALVLIVISAAAVAVTSLMLFYLNTASGVTGIDAAFEAVSAFATVGVSSGVTEVANIPSRLLIACVMFMGRVGPVSLALSLSLDRDKKTKTQVIPEGKVIVG